MIPFASVSAAILWWRSNAVHRNVSLLVDFTDIGKGIQRREARYNSRDGWFMGFPDGGQR